MFKCLAAQIVMRHSFLKQLIGTKPEEDLSYENTLKVLIATTVAIVALCFLETSTYFLYNAKVHLN